MVDYPAKESQTIEGRLDLTNSLLGTGTVLLTPDKAASGPTDVYALAKTLWVLATGQNYPLPGFLSRQIPQLRVSSYVSDERAGLVDALLERGILNTRLPRDLACANTLKNFERG